ncbi:hypothetical protein TTRE_0000843701 [Trichuris trichiura]|uniref:Uncharacterized protein n=1 Tax=Trichuris trichiura TaxID=36087 RepID=A0A077ZI76_TRITR|nr:hypothetical protein TTRE_0000843701 [Trichuris trichiura]
MLLRWIIRLHSGMVQSSHCRRVRRLCPTQASRQGVWEKHAQPRVAEDGVSDGNLQHYKSCDSCNDVPDDSARNRRNIFRIVSTSLLCSALRPWKRSDSPRAYGRFRI